MSLPAVNTPSIATHPTLPFRCAAAAGATVPGQTGVRHEADELSQEKSGQVEGVGVCGGGGSCVFLVGVQCTGM